MPDVFIGAGSNIEPAHHLRLAVAALAERFGELLCSDVYRSPPYGFEGAPFLNMVIGFRTSDSPDDIERELNDIEYEGGRRRRCERFSSRTLDLDLLLYGAAVDPARRLPRVDILLYPFVLAPLVEIAPGLRHPLTGQRLDREWAARRVTVHDLERLGRIESDAI